MPVIYYGNRESQISQHFSFFLGTGLFSFIFVYYKSLRTHFLANAPRTIIDLMKPECDLSTRKCADRFFLKINHCSNCSNVLAEQLLAFSRQPVIASTAALLRGDEGREGRDGRERLGE